MKKIVVLLSLLFTLFSFTPTFIEIASRFLVPKERAFLLEHNYLFDYNFYLSRIRQGYEENRAPPNITIPTTAASATFAISIFFFSSLIGVVEFYHWSTSECQVALTN